MQQSSRMKRHSWSGSGLHGAILGQWHVMCLPQTLKRRVAGALAGASWEVEMPSAADAVERIGAVHREGGRTVPGT